jgi:hypothetical protein
VTATLIRVRWRRAKPRPRGLAHDVATRGARMVQASADPRRLTERVGQDCPDSIRAEHAIVYPVHPGTSECEMMAPYGVDGSLSGAFKQHAPAGVRAHLGDSRQLAILLAMPVGFGPHFGGVRGEPFEHARPAGAGALRTPKEPAPLQ